MEYSRENKVFGEFKKMNGNEMEGNQYSNHYSNNNNNKAGNSIQRNGNRELFKIDRSNHRTVRNSSSQTDVSMSIPPMKPYQRINIPTKPIIDTGEDLDDFIVLDGEEGDSDEEWNGGYQHEDEEWNGYGKTCLRVADIPKFTQKIFTEIIGLENVKHYDTYALRTLILSSALHTKKFKNSKELYNFIKSCIHHYGNEYILDLK